MTPHICKDFSHDNYCYHCGEKRFTTSTLNGKWPSDTWFRRALARKLKADAEELEAQNELRKV